MNKPLKIVKIGNSAGVILPKEVLGELGADIGDTLRVTSSRASLTLTRDDPEFERQLGVARSVMAKRRAALRELAK